MCHHRRTLLARAAVPAALLVLTTTLAACGGNGDEHADSGSDAQSATHPDDPGDWTVFVYMNADNNLEPAAIADLQEMTEARDTQFVVLVDRAPGYSSDDAVGQGDFEDSRLLKILDGQVELVDQPGELDMGDPAVLSTFISTGLEDYRRDHNAVVVWDHGGAWHGAAWDETSEDDNLELPELDSGIKEGLAGGGTTKVDMIGFDACLMADTAVASTLAPYADYYVSSEEVEPGQGWDWSGLTDSADSTATDFTNRIVDSYAAAATTAGINDTTLSVVDLSKIGEVTDAVDALTEVLSSPDAEKVVGRISSARASSVSFGRDPDPAADHWMVDLGDLADQLAAVPETQDAAGQLKSAIADAVVAGKYGPLASTATGLAIYFPDSAEHRDPGYTAAQSALIDAFYARAGEVPDDEIPFYTDTDRLLSKKEGEVTDTSTGVDLRAPVTAGLGGNISFAKLFWGKVNTKNPNEVIFFGRRRGSVDGDVVQGSYDWNYLTVGDGTATSVAFADLSYAPDGTLAQIAIPLRYLRGTSKIRGRLVLSLAAGKVTAETFYGYLEGGGVAAIEPEPGDAFLPLLRYENLGTGADRWVPATNQPITTDSSALQFSYDRLPAANAVMLGLTFEGVNGFRDRAYYGTSS